MRTVEVKFVHKLDATMGIELSTEVIVADDEDAREAGEQAKRVLDEFLNGMSDAQNSD